MSTPREELHTLIDSMSDKAAAELLPELRLLKLQAEARTEPARTSSTWPPAWFGSGTGSRPDIAQRSEDILRDEFGRRE